MSINHYIVRSVKLSVITTVRMLTHGNIEKREIKHFSILMMTVIMIYDN